MQNPADILKRVRIFRYGDKVKTLKEPDLLTVDYVILTSNGLFVQTLEQPARFRAYELEIVIPASNEVRRTFFT